MLLELEKHMTEGPGSIECPVAVSEAAVPKRDERAALRNDLTIEIDHALVQPNRHYGTLVLPRRPGRSLHVGGVQHLVVDRDVGGRDEEVVLASNASRVQRVEILVEDRDPRRLLHHVEED